MSIYQGPSCQVQGEVVESGCDDGTTFFTLLL
jgi:hypothetical protein